MGRRSPRAAPRRARRRAAPPLGLLLAPALAGAALTAYLSFNAWFGAALPFCGAGSSCDLVQSSRWSTLLGLPMAFWGFLSYAALGALSWGLGRSPWRWKLAWTLSLVGLAVSLYLTAISAFVIQAFCAWCLLSLGLIAVCFGVVARARPASMAGFQWRDWGPATGALAAAVVVALHLHYSGLFDSAAGPEDPYLQGLAQHLRDSGARFYGASWCPHCNEQKALFGASGRRLPYVECSPDGRHSPPAAECLLRGIEGYPTWIIDGVRYEGLLQPRELARRSGYAPPPEEG